jgi:hypothetical protein
MAMNAVSVTADGECAVSGYWDKTVRMTVGELRREYAEVFGEQTRSYHKEFLVRRIAWRIQANAEGGLADRARQRALEIAPPTATLSDSRALWLTGGLNFTGGLLSESFRIGIYNQGCWLPAVERWLFSSCSPLLERRMGG